MVSSTTPALKSKFLNKHNISLLSQLMREYFSVDDNTFHDFLGKKAEFLELFSGDVLIRQGDESDDVYFLLSGRLRAFTGKDQNSRTPVGEMGRGEIVGELAMFTDEVRAASVIAIRNSIVAKVSRETVEMAIKKNPSIALQITRQVITRFRKQSKRNQGPAPATIISVLGLDPNTDLNRFVESMSRFIKKYSGKIAIVDQHDIAKQFGPLSEPDIARPGGELSQHISKLEAENDLVFLLADRSDLHWSITATHHCDEILLVGDANKTPEVSEFERRIGEENANADVNARQTLVLMHGDDVKSPKGTKHWLEPRNIERHIHIRPHLERDWGRLARILSGNAIGLVLSGGGARGFAHIGVATALTKMGVEIDYVGGTSAGAIMASWIAMDVSGDEFVNSARGIFVESPVGNISGDINPLPLVSLIKGKRAKYVTEHTINKHAGGDIDLEDSWINFFVIASNYSTHKEQVITHGNFAKAVMASFSIPGLLPPTLINGEIFYDGGSFNNFPVDVMQRIGAKQIIGVDLMSDYQRRFNFDEVPSPSSILIDSFKKRRNKKFKLPKVSDTLLTATFITSMARQRVARDQVNLLFKPDLFGVGMLDWKKFDRVVKSSHEKALAQLSELPKSKLKMFQA